MALSRLIIAFMARVMPRRCPERRIRTPSTCTPWPRWQCRVFCLCEDFDLLDGLIERMTVIRIARYAPAADHQAFPEGGGNADLNAKLVGRSGLALRDALCLRCVQRIQSVLIPGLLRQDTPHAVQQILRFGLCLLWPEQTGRT